MNSSPVAFTCTSNAETDAATHTPWPTRWGNEGGARRPTSRGALTACILTLVLAGCGGSGGGETEASILETSSQACDVPDQRNFLAQQFREEYLWTDLTPDVDPAPRRSVSDYFRASLFAGDELLPADRYSGFQSAESFSLFFGEGQTMGYGLAVAGVEVRGQPDAPLWIRDVTPASPAALAGLQRGDRVVSLNDRPAAELIARDDFSALSARQVGEVLDIQVERQGQLRRSQIQSAVHPVGPVRHSRIIELPDGRRVGVLRYQAMITVGDEALRQVMGRFRDARVDAVILDLRYNGGGSVAVGQRLASHLTGPGPNGRLYAELRYNSQQTARNQFFRFNHTLGWAGVKRVYVLAGSRTCSASEQVISGLRGVGLEVVTVGSTTCGKPVGFAPVTYCGQTYSITNFESLNDAGQGRYFDGLKADCPVAEDFRVSLEDTAEPLTATALRHFGEGRCNGAVATDRQIQTLRRLAPVVRDGPELPGVMLP